VAKRISSFSTVDDAWAFTAREPSADWLAARARATILQTSERGTIEIMVDEKILAVQMAR
jgi:hypothetical protein